MNSWFKLPTLETKSQQFTSQTLEHTLKLCEAFETYKMWAKVLWKGGSNFSLVWAVPARQWTAGSHIIDFSGFWIRHLHPFQNKFWSLNWKTQLWTALAQDKASLHKSCVLVQCGIHGQVTLWLHCYERDSSVAMGFMGSNTGRGLADGFHCSLRWYKYRWNLPGKPRASSLHLLSKEMAFGRWCCRNSSFPLCGAQWGTKQGLVELRGCKPAVAGRRAVMRQAFVYPAEEEGDLYMVCVCLVLELDRQLYIGFVTCLQRGES